MGEFLDITDNGCEPTLSPNVVVESRENLKKHRFREEPPWEQVAISYFDMSRRTGLP